MGSTDSADSQKRYLKYGEQNVRNSLRKQRISGVSGCEGQRELAEKILKVDLSMESKM